MIFIKVIKNVFDNFDSKSGFITYFLNTYKASYLILLLMKILKNQKEKENNFGIIIINTVEN